MARMGGQAQVGGQLPGIKDPARMEAFIAAVRDADESARDRGATATLSGRYR